MRALAGDPARPLLSIQYLRAFAALAVVVFHACQWSDVDFDIGAGGVDVFFIISGFLMWRITQDPAVTPMSFLRRRIVRVVPLYWIATLALALLAIAAPQMIRQLRPTAPHLVLSLLFIPHLDPDGIPFPFLPPGWTLNYEAILYLIFTASLAAPRARRLALVVGVLGLITVAGLIVRSLFPLFANPMMLEFAAGVLLARFAEDGRWPSRGMGWSLIGLGLVTFAMLRVLGIHSDIGRWILWGGPAVVIVAGALAVEAAGGLPRSAILKRLGDASYSIYLCHWPIIAIAAKLAGERQLWLFVPVVTLAALAAGLAVHVGVEAPLIRLLRRRPPRPAFSVP
ncbi:MAG TPA: acyltransferase [Caulobacteraceae bacterium]|jgi:exopolysaccharide production protein ExoZ|nr:acyltransferase [Caulobacteraceae bacterium]